MLFSPKLKKAMAEVREVLERHDLTGVVVLHSEDWGEYFSEFLLKLNSTKSCATVEHGEIRVRAKAGDEKLLYTANMLNLLAEVTGKTSLSLLKLSEMVDSITGASHSESGFVPDNYFDN